MVAVDGAGGAAGAAEEETVEEGSTAAEGVAIGASVVGGTVPTLPREAR